MKKLIWLMPAMAMLLACQTDDVRYIDAELPTETPRLFAPGLVSKPGSMEYAGVFSPDMQTFYFSHRDSLRSDQRIWETHRLKRGWSVARPAEFAADAMSYEPLFTADGRMLYFGSQRDFPGRPDSQRLTHFWKMRRQGHGWSEPAHVDSVLSEALPSYLAVSASSTFYFGSYIRPGIQCLAPGDTVKPLSPAVNSLAGAGHPYIAPDESFIIFDAQDGPGHQGAFDLYISRRQPDGKWGAAINLGPGVNTPAAELCGSVTPDGRYLLFNRSGLAESDLYWVSASVLPPG